MLVSVEGMQADAVMVGVYLQQVGDVGGRFSLPGIGLYLLIDFLKDEVVVHGNGGKGL